MAFGGGSSGSAALTAHTHNQTLAGDGGQLSETLTDMNGVTLFSLIEAQHSLEVHEFTTAETWTPTAQTGIMEVIIDSTNLTGGALSVFVDTVIKETITTPTISTRIYDPTTSFSIQSLPGTTVGYTGINFDYGTTEVSTADLVSVNYGDSGTKLYLASNAGGTGNQKIYQYTLSTAFDVSTATYANLSFPDPFSNTMRGMSWRSDGSTWIRASDDTGSKAFVQFNPSTNWDISTSGAVVNSFVVSSYQTGVKDCIFGNSGLQVTSLSQGNTLYTYDLSTAYDISTASNSSKNLSLDTIDNASRSHAWNSDGTKCYYLGNQNQKVYTLDCSSAWDITSMTHTAANDIDISGQTSAVYGIDTSGGVTPTSIIVGSIASPYSVYDYGAAPFAGSVLATVKVND